MKPCTKEEAVQAIDHSEKVFKRTFYEEQKCAIEAFLTGSDIFVGLPTGFGKSVIFQSIPVCYDFINSTTDGHTASNSTIAIGVVVSPLVSLCRNQVHSLSELGISAVFLGDIKDEQTWNNVKSGKYSLVYSSPEFLLSDDGAEILTSKIYTDRLCGLFVDEAHCIAKWGFASSSTNAFREMYGKLAQLRSLSSSNVRLAVFSATATPEVRGIIIRNLALQNLFTITRLPNRPNIRYSVSHAPHTDLNKTFLWLLNIMKEKKAETPRVIIYCQRLQDCSELYGIFEDGMGDRDMDVPSRERHYAMYHSQTGGNEAVMKTHVEESFSDEKGIVRVLFATVAFGMGIDAKGLYTVIHYGAPEGIDDYLQESGRAGRQGELSSAHLIHHPKAFVVRKTNESMKVYVHNKATCRRTLLIKPFADDDSHDIDIPDLTTTFSCCDICDPNERSWVEDALHKSLHKQTEVQRLVTDDERQELGSRLQTYRHKLIEDLPLDGSLGGPDLATGFPLALVEQILKSADSVLTFDEFWNLHGFCDKQQAEIVYAIVQEVLGDCCQIETLHAISFTDSDESETVEVPSEDEYQEITLQSSDSDSNLSLSSDDST